MINNNFFLRYEFKYFMSSKISQEIFRQSLNFMSIDNFALKNKNQKYLVRSLYFDNDCFSHFNEKADGIKNRHKFRIRTYSDQFNKDSIFYLEQKGRDNESTYKVRTKIYKDDLDLFFDKKDLFKLKKKYPENYLIEK